MLLFFKYSIKEFHPSITEKVVDVALKLAMEYIYIKGWDSYH